MQCFSQCTRAASHIHPPQATIDTVVGALVVERAAVTRYSRSTPLVLPLPSVLMSNTDLNLSGKGKYSQEELVRASGGRNRSHSLLKTITF